MRVRRTGAKRGQSPTWYIQASTELEREAIRRNELEDRSPSWRYPYVLIWGFQSKQAAEKEIEVIRPVVKRACERTQVMLDALEKYEATIGESDD